MDDELLRQKIIEILQNTWGRADEVADGGVLL